MHLEGTVTTDKELTSATVVIPSFNAAGTLPETLRSVIPELGPCDEVIVVDDGSSDDTAEVVQAFNDDRIRYIYQSNSGGPARPRNRGIAEARGKLIFLFDSDDLMMPGKIEAAKTAYLSYPDVGLIFSNFMTINKEGKTLTARFLDAYELTGPFAVSDRPVRLEVPVACRAMARENFVGTSGVAIPKWVFNRIGPFDETLTNGDDRDMWFRVTRHFPAVYIPQVFHCYRIGENSISMGSAHKRTPAKLKVLEQQLADPLDEVFANDLRELIADNYHALAYESFSKGNMQECRAEIAKGWRASKRGVWIRLWAFSLLGGRGTSLLRQFKRALVK